MEKTIQQQDPMGIEGATYSEIFVEVGENVALRVLKWQPRQAGDPAPVVFVAGWVSAVSGWAPLIRQLALKRTVYYIETREKRSAIIRKKPLTHQDFTIAQFARDLVKVCEHLGINHGNTVMAGSSLGATAILEALKNGDLKAGSAFLIGPNSEFKAPSALKWLLYLPAGLYHVIKYFVLWYLRTFKVDTRKEPEQMARYDETLRSAHPLRIKLSARALILKRYQVWPGLDTIPAPVALAYAPSDTLHSHQDIFQMAKAMPRAALIECPSNKYMHSRQIAGDIETFAEQAGK